MCGIAGLWRNLGADQAPDLETSVIAMAAALSHRGPDAAGMWSDVSTGVALGHQRLAVVDLSPAGHQPMASASGRYRIAFNGEIYNHQALRQELEGSALLLQSWRGHSDTETLLAGFAIWGIPETVERCVGMFAFAVWDKKEKLLTLGRDRIGEKPLYYNIQDGSLIFSSEPDKFNSASLLYNFPFLTFK